MASSAALLGLDSRISGRSMRRTVTSGRGFLGRSSGPSPATTRDARNTHGSPCPLSWSSRTSAKPWLSSGLSVFAMRRSLQSMKTPRVLRSMDPSSLEGYSSIWTRGRNPVILAFCCVLGRLVFRCFPSSAYILTRSPRNSSRSTSSGSPHDDEAVGEHRSLALAATETPSATDAPFSATVSPSSANGSPLSDAPEVAFERSLSLFNAPMSNLIKASLALISTVMAGPLLWWFDFAVCVKTMRRSGLSWRSVRFSWS
mmetsp:Transcript_12135/g.24516  ORF Transcript_12135/g.24516 Transcript_12135/m.24516 type:complete len:257 (+) Transcript_12135:4320-5090(+)